MTTMTVDSPRLPRLFSRLSSRPALRRFPLALLLLAATAPMPALAQDTATPPAWDQLNNAQREQLLAPLRERWDAEPAARARMLEHARRWQQMTPEQRQGAHRGLRRWEHMAPDQREQMRALFEQMRASSPEQREALKKQWRAMTPEQRHAWVQAHPPSARTRERPQRN